MQEHRADRVKRHTDHADRNAVLPAGGRPAHAKHGGPQFRQRQGRQGERTGINAGQSAGQVRHFTHIAHLAGHAWPHADKKKTVQTIRWNVRQCPAVSLRITRHVAASAAPLLTDTPAHILAAVTPDRGPRGTIQLFVLGRAVAKRGERRAAPRQNSSGAVFLSFRTQVFCVRTLIWYSCLLAYANHLTYANVGILTYSVRKIGILVFFAYAGGILGLFHAEGKINATPYTKTLSRETLRTQGR